MLKLYSVSTPLLVPEARGPDMQSNVMRVLAECPWKHVDLQRGHMPALHAPLTGSNMYMYDTVSQRWCSCSETFAGALASLLVHMRMLSMLSVNK